MAVTSIKNLCKQLVSLAIQRCRLSGDPCRISVIIRRSTMSDHPLTHISISDTGSGSCLKEFQDLRYTYNRLTATGWGWDGMLSITTTGIGDSELFHYDINLKQSAPSRRLTKLPSMPKQNAVFRGSEVSLSTSEDMEVLLADMMSFFKKIRVLKICNIAMELVGEFGDQHGSRNENFTLATELASPSPESSNIEQLTSGLEDYVYRHGAFLTEKCLSCFSESDNLKVGSGKSCQLKNMNDILIAEAVIMISKASDPSSPSCSKAFEPKTEVLYFRDFSPCSIDQPALKALRSVKWTNYGLTLRSIADDQCPVLLEWENIPPNTHIDIVMHCYNDQYVSVPQLRQKTRLEKKLMKEAISLALDDLKERYSGCLLSAHVVKIHAYAPDLARSIAGLIMSSNDPNFQGECLSLLGMQTNNIESELVEDCIKQKLLSAIDINDRKTPSQHSEDIPALFGDENCQDSKYMMDDCEMEEDDCYIMDF